MSPHPFHEFARSVAAGVDALVQRVAAEAATAARLAGSTVPPLSWAQANTLQQVLGAPGSAAPWQAALAAQLRAAVDEAIAGAPRHPARPAMPAMPAAPGQPPALRLKDDDEVAEDIELARLTEQLESAAESVLLELRARIASLRADAAVTRDGALLHPQACATALGRAVRRLELAVPLRLALLQRLAAAMVPALARCYAEQLERLKALGVAPARFSVLPQAPAATRQPADGAAAALATAAQATQVAQVLARLVAQARTELDGAHFEPLDDLRMPRPATPPDAAQAAMPIAAAQAAMPIAAAPAATPTGAARAPVPIGAELGARLMRQLLAQLVEQGQAAASMRTVFQRLEGPGQRLAAHDPGLWSRHSHPWWQLLDRLVALCAVLEDGPGGRQEALAARCEGLVARLVEVAAPDEALCRAALAEVSTFAVELAAPAPAPAPPSPPVATGEAARFEAMVRAQMAAQLRSSQAPAVLRRFLLGPWVDVLVHAMAQPERAGPTLQQHTELVDALLQGAQAGARAAPVTSLLQAVRDGLRQIGMPEDPIQQWLFDLTMRLSDPAQPELPAADEGTHWRHDELPTVPIDLHGSLQGARARRDCEAWLRSLRAGDILRVYIDARWQTLHLVALDPAQQFILQGRDSGGVRQALSRRALERLRGEGLATTVELGAFVARAMDTMAARLDALGDAR